MLNTAAAMKQLIERWNAFYRLRPDGLPRLEQSAGWTSVCEIPDSQIDGMVAWQPVKNDTPGDFSNIESALSCILHDDIKAFYNAYWSGDLALQHDKGPVSLLQVYNKQDLDSLQQNMVGHIMMKRQLKQAVTVFFALTDLDDQMISMINENGEIWLEYVGKEPHLKLADNMADFLGMLEPG